MGAKELRAGVDGKLESGSYTRISAGFELALWTVRESSNQEQKLRYDIYQRPEVSRLVDI
jgi:hypothetical protein